MGPNRGLVSNYLGYRGMANRLRATYTSQDTHWPVSCTSARQSNTHIHKKVMWGSLSSDSSQTSNISVYSLSCKTIDCFRYLSFVTFFMFYWGKNYDNEKSQSTAVKLILLCCKIFQIFLFYRVMSSSAFPQFLTSLIRSVLWNFLAQGNFTYCVTCHGIHLNLCEGKFPFARVGLIFF